MHLKKIGGKAQAPPKALKWSEQAASYPPGSDDVEGCYAGCAAEVRPFSDKHHERAPMMPKAHLKWFGKHVATGDKPVMELEPEACIDKNMKVSGDLTFLHLLRIDGAVSGALHTSGSVIVSSTGSYKGELKGLRAVYVEGVVDGDVKASHVLVKEGGVIHGNIMCNTLEVGPEATVSGSISTQMTESELGISKSKEGPEVEQLPSISTTAPKLLSATGSPLVNDNGSPLLTLSEFLIP
ncbi:unnamed protein product [Chrysoparadoxa australica]